MPGSPLAARIRAVFLVGCRIALLRLLLSLDDRFNAGGIHEEELRLHTLKKNVRNRSARKLYGYCDVR
jgi:hypothetical protein